MARMPRSRSKRNERGNCGGIVLIIAAVMLVCFAAWLWAAVDDAYDDTEQRCRNLKSWYEANPYDSNPDLRREYDQVCHD